MTVIPAPAGFRLVTAFKGESGLGDNPAALAEAVIAFAIDIDTSASEPVAYPLPITPNRRAWSRYGSRRACS